MRDYTCDEPFPLYWNECHHGAGSADRVCNAAYEQWVGVVDKLDRSAAHAMWKHTSMSPYQPALYYPLEDAVRELARVGQRAG